MKVNMDDLLLAGLLDNDDELILLSQVCSGPDILRLHVQKMIWQRFIELRFCLYLPDLSMETYKEILQVANLFHSQPN